MLEMRSNGREVVARLANFRELLTPALLEAESKSLDAVQHSAVDYMYSQMIDPQGPLEDAFYQVIEVGANSISGQLVNPLDYAWRQEEGFSGMTDSLGRFFSWTPEYHYMQKSLQAQLPTIEQYFSDAVAESLDAL